jgi:hypothetical protein
MLAWLGETIRPTRDADLLGFGDLSEEALAVEEKGSTLKSWRRRGQGGEGVNAEIVYYRTAAQYCMSSALTQVSPSVFAFTKPYWPRCSRQ